MEMECVSQLIILSIEPPKQRGSLIFVRIVFGTLVVMR
jgi:hypothetical protein